MINTLDFTNPSLDRLPPENLEAEESVLGSILLDLNAIYRVWNKLKPLHFYSSAYREIYQACIKLAKQQKPTDLISVADYLSNHGKLERVGGRSQLASLVQRTVSSANIDYLSELIVEKFIRREAIKLGHKFIDLGHQGDIELSELLSTIKQKTDEVTDCFWNSKDKDPDRWNYERLLNELKTIHLGISDSGYKIYKIQELAKAHNKRVSDLEQIYQKSLCSVVGSRQTLDELETSLGSQERKLLLGGLIPAATTILLHADGGVGKTKLFYDLIYSLATGANWNGFPVTAPKRKVLIYQGDESQQDMLQALNQRGFTAGSDAREQIQHRFGWNMDAIPLLLQDIQEFKPDLIFIDSLTYVNRFSIYDENRTEYARPILELTSIAQEHGVTIVLVHHSNRANGKSRGTTAIFNSVSEVLKLERDTSAGANPQQKILSIEKSRSRRFPCSYRLMFNEEDFSFSLLEEVGHEMGDPDASTKDRIVAFLQAHPNIRYEAGEIAYHISTTDGNARRCCNQLARDGIISCSQRSASGSVKTYYIRSEGGDCNTKPPDLQNATTLQSRYNNTPSRISGQNDQSVSRASNADDDDTCIKKMRSPCDHHAIALSDRLTNPCPVNDTAKGDPSVHQKCENSDQEKIISKGDQRITFAGNACSEEVSEGDRKGDRKVIKGDRLNDGSPLQTEQLVLQIPQSSNESNNTSAQSNGFVPFSQVRMKIDSAAGDVKAIATRRSANTYDIQLLLPDGTERTFTRKAADEKEVKSQIKREVTAWKNSLTFSVQEFSEETGEHIWHKGCKCIGTPCLHQHNPYWVFATPAWRKIQVLGKSQFKLES